MGCVHQVIPFGVAIRGYDSMIFPKRPWTTVHLGYNLSSMKTNAIPTNPRDIELFIIRILTYNFISAFDNLLLTILLYGIGTSL